MIPPWIESSACYARRMELLVISRFMAEGFECFMPAVDDNGTDFVAKTSSGRFIELQVKARKLKENEPGLCTLGSGRFQVKNPVERPNYYYIFIVEQLNKMWCFSAKEYLKECSRHKSGKNMDKTSLVLLSPSSKPRPKYQKYEIKQEEFSKKFK